MVPLVPALGWPFAIAALTTLASFVAMPSEAIAQVPCANPVALFESVKNSVQIVQASAAASQAATRQVRVCPGDTIRVGDNSRAVIIILASNTPLAIDQNSELIIPAPPEGPGSFINLLRGALLYISRVRRATGVNTPFVNASIEGTEFLVRVTTDRTEITVFEGAVRAANDAGNVLVGPGQRAVAIQKQAPQLEVVVSPRDAVQWALYYEPIMPADSFDTLALIPDADRDAQYYVRRAALLLGVGQVETARTDLDLALQNEPANGDAFALRAIVAVALNDRDGAVTNGRAAVERAPQSLSARLALSYALQATFDLISARNIVEQAIVDHLEDGSVWARLAELRLMLDDVRGASDAGRRAAMLSPQLARVQAVRGFTALAELKLSEAEAAFQQAIILESDNPTARLGLGLAQIRRGQLPEGRSTLDVAAALNPGNSLIRAYLGKAYYEERRNALADQQFAMSKNLDPRDPTPWFYNAVQKHGLNRPVEALGDFNRAIELNDNRAVYRSRLLLDSDLAARGARLGRLYRDLGFEQLALQEGWTSIAIDPADYSAHRLLADGYLLVPRHQIARDSELLQAQLLQPLNLSPVQPRLASSGPSLFLDDGSIASIGYNEFTPLFGSRRLRVIGDLVGGEHDTQADNLIASGVFNRWSYSVGQFRLSSDGIRPNNDFEQSIYNGFLQASISSSTSALVEIRGEDVDKGDRRMLFDSTNYLAGLRNPSTAVSVRAGGRHSFATGSTLIGSYVHRRLDADLETGEGLRVVTDEDADLFEIRHLQKWRQVQITAGAGRYVGTRIEARSVGPRAFPSTTTPIRHNNVYTYATVGPTSRFNVVLGVAQDHFEGGLDRSQTNPKLGLTWSVLPSTMVRAAVFRSFKRTLISSQTIEPTHVAGFNQFFDETNATDSWRSGLAVDHKFGAHLFSGIEVSVRDLVVPTRVAATGAVNERKEDERIIRVYTYWAPIAILGVSTEYRHERLERDPSGNNADLLADATTQRLAVEGRVFLGSGIFGRIGTTFIDQDGRWLQNSTRLVVPGADRFATINVGVGWRLPRQYGVLAVEASNLTNESFSFQDSTPEDPRILPGRTITARLSLGF